MDGLDGRRLLVGGLSLAGLAIAAYLTLVQTKVVTTVWDPFSPGGSEWILRRSPLVRWLGFPDAAFGIAAYGAEFVLDLAGTRGGRATRRWAVLALGALAGAMAAGSVVLVTLQALYRHWCSLCLVSAGVSLAIAAAAVPAARDALASGRSADRSERGQGVSRRRDAPRAVRAQITSLDNRRNPWPESSSSPGRPRA